MSDKPIDKKPRAEQRLKAPIVQGGVQKIPGQPVSRLRPDQVERLRRHGAL